MSMNLDSRQRAMLAEIGVRVWQPLATEISPEAEAQAMPVTTVAAPVPALATPPRPSPRPLTPPPPTDPATSRIESPTRPLQALPVGITEMDWNGLKQAAAACQACALCEHRTRSVFADGTPAVEGQAVDWLIVGDVPGDAEDASGLPFDGPARPLLTAMLQAMGLTSTGGGQPLPPSVVLINALKCKGSPQRPTLAEEIAQCQPYLARQIALLRPRVILALGRVAAQAVLQVPGASASTEGLPLGKLRGQVHRAHGSAVIVSYHPSCLLRSPADKARAWADICLGMAQLQAVPG